ncbi:MAG: N-acetylmuramoyl-L-alanine amidase [Gemmatimonadaceae bacterium]|nr:N-acetylmuramoyl-L-alanine amidase [Gemmatimonadaceae bacterium]
MRLRDDCRALSALVLLLAAACGGAVSSSSNAPVPVPASTSTTARPLPPVPAVDGPLAVRVTYPGPNQEITSRDSNFIFGSVGSGRASLTINGAPARVYPNGAFIAYVVNPQSSGRYELVALRGSDSARLMLPVRFRTVRVVSKFELMPAKPENQPTSRADTIAALNARVDSLRTLVTRNDPIGLVQLGQSSALGDTDRTIVGRPIAGGTYKWFFLPGTVVPVVERVGNSARVRLDRDLDVWVDTADAQPVAAGTVAPARVVSNMRTRGGANGVDVIIPVGARPPYLVEEADRAIVLTLYGTRANTDIVNYGTGDSLVRVIEWSQERVDRARITVRLRAAPYGYLVAWENNALVLRLRGRPAIDERRPLAGLRLVVDPGHPPIGATGPTGLREAQATLLVGLRLRELLQERGATVVMTRTEDVPVELGLRPIIARRANAHAFVSVHYNAYGDGTNPFLASGTGTYFFRAHSQPLAREVQRSLVAQIGLVDLGINYDNLAVTRPTWYPAILTEGAFMMLPDQEAAMRTPEFQDRYARGIADGLESYFRALPAR